MTRSPFWELIKPRIVLMVLVTTATGFLVGRESGTSWFTLIWTIIGTALGAAGSAVLNNYVERDSDAYMERTRSRALPSGRIEPGIVLLYGVGLVLSGVTLLVNRVNLLSGFLVLLTAFLYVLVYTPMKRLSWWNTPVGAIPGAIPPMVGWAAARGELGPGAWILFAILFTWQHPHFYSIAWMYRADYSAAGLRMLSVVDPSGRRIFRQSIVFCLALIAASTGLHLLGLASGFYMFGAALAGAAMLVTCINFREHPSNVSARRVLLASVIYLPILLALIVLDAGFIRGLPTAGN